MNQKYHYHQKFDFYEQRVDWEIYSFDSRVSDVIDKELALNKNILITQKDAKLKIISVTKGLDFPISEWIQKLQSLQLKQETVYLEFVNPTSHKVQGEHLKRFDLEVCYKHILRKFNLLQEILYLDDHTLDFLMAYTQVIANDTKATAMHLKRVKLPAFYGGVILKWIGPAENLPIFNLLWLFAEKAGIGVKTAMGYGDMRIR